MKKPLRVFAAVLIALAGVCFVLTVFMVGISDKDVAERDFISYWAAGQLLVHGQNPYDFRAVRELELKAGRDPHELLLMMRNPPFAFFLVLPFGFAGPKVSLIAWLAVLMGMLTLAIQLVWRLNGRPDNPFHLLGFVFAPALACLMAGQFGLVMLVGVALFLTLHRNQPFLAGVALSLCSLKPHYFLPFAVALLLWCLTAKAFRIVAGFCASMAAMCAFAYMLDPHAWGQYAQMMQAGGALNEEIPVLSAQLRLINPHAVWIQFVPEAAACVLAIWYFWSRRSCWNWMDHGLVLLLVGAFCTPFGWFFDESVLLPAVLTGLYRAIKSRRPLWPLAVFAGVALAELLMNVQVISRFYLWTTPAWLGWYLYATGRLSARTAVSA
jgi:Glycosyltransferase family 87